MGDELVDRLIEWLESWRAKNNIIDDAVLSENAIEKFIGELQAKITTEIGDFGPATSEFENAYLVLYTGTDFNLVNEFCESSNGKYYMINQTNASVLWDNDFRDAIANVIGEADAESPITARILAGKSYDSTGRGTRISNYATDSENYLALDDFLSSKVAEAGLKQGDVMYVISPSARSNSVGLSTEVC